MTVEQRVVDELSIELAALRHDVIAVCDYAEPRLAWLHPVAAELGPQVEQVIAGALHSLARLRRRATT